MLSSALLNNNKYFLCVEFFFKSSLSSPFPLSIRVCHTQAENMTPANTFYLFTCLSVLFCLPLTLALEGRNAARIWSAAVPDGAAAVSLLWLICQSALYFTAYSEVQFKALDQISPVTHAVGNTMRRVVIMLVCIGVFGTPMTPLAAMGSVLAIGGSFLYSMVKAEEKRKAKEAVLDAKLAQALPLKVDAGKKAE